MSEVATLDDIESWLGNSLPSEYRDFLNTCAVESIVSDLVLLYGRATFVERNETHETRDYCPGFVTVGNDSGDMEIVMSLRDASIYMVDGGSMRIEHAKPLDTKFSTWLKADCPLPENENDSIEWPVDALSEVCLYLERPPTNVRNLLMIKRHLKIPASIAELKAAADSSPCRIANGMTYAKARIRCHLIDQEDQCVGIRLASDESQKLPK